MPKVRFRRSAKRELFELDDDAFLRVARAILELQENPRPRGCDKVAGRVDQLRVWAGRDHRVLYEVDERSGHLTIVAVRKKDESTYKYCAVRKIGDTPTGTAQSGGRARRGAAVRPSR